jgi:hypothetical protein
MCGKGIKIGAEIVPLFNDDGKSKVRDEGVFTATRIDETDMTIYLGIHTHTHAHTHTHCTISHTHRHRQTHEHN